MARNRRPVGSTPVQPSRAADLFDAASAHFAAGRFKEAEALFKDLAGRNHRAGLCCQFLGLIEQGRGRLRKALDYLDRAVALDAMDVSALANRASLLAVMGRPEDALASLDRALIRKPDQAELLANRGALLQSLGRTAEAVTTFEQALALNPDIAQAWDNLATALAALDETDRALAAVDRALALAPNNPLTHYSKANCLAAMDRHAEALACYDRALAIRPGWAEAENNRANSLRALGRNVVALLGYERALAVQPDYIPAMDNRARLLWRERRLEEALAAYDQMLAVGLADAAALCGRGNVLLDQGHFEEARAAFTAALAKPTGDAQYHIAARYGIAIAQLVTGRFHAGWDDYESRFEFQTIFGSPGQKPKFDGYIQRPSLSDVKGRSVVVLREQGIGDEVMFASVLPDLIRDAAQVTYAGEDRLIRLFGASFPGAEVLAEADMSAARLAGFDTVLAAGSLGYLYRREPGSFPGTPYLTPTSSAQDSWAHRLGPRTGRCRVGVAWRGGVKQMRQAERSLSLNDLRPILDLPGHDFVSLQYGDVAEEIAAFNAGRARPITLFPRADIEDFDDLAGLMANLDVVVSVQNTLVHMSGALGLECLTLVPANPEWRYGAEGERMAWYGSVRLFRQSRESNWQPTIAAVADRLRESG